MASEGKLAALAHLFELPARLPPPLVDDPASSEKCVTSGVHAFLESVQAISRNRVAPLGRRMAVGSVISVGFVFAGALHTPSASCIPVTISSSRFAPGWSRNAPGWLENAFSGLGVGSDYLPANLRVAGETVSTETARFMAIRIDDLRPDQVGTWVTYTRDSWGPCKGRIQTWNQRFILLSTIARTSGTDSWILPPQPTNPENLDFV
jgi:hypothetical protein